jgi:hypothetical protein
MNALWERGRDVWIQSLLFPWPQILRDLEREGKLLGTNFPGIKAAHTPPCGSSNSTCPVLPEESS